MGRILLSLLLTVNLLACPVRCGVCAASNASVDPSPQPACCCCAKQCEVPAPELPTKGIPTDRSGEECQCQDCICEGATLQTAPRLPGSMFVAALSVVPAAKRVGNKKSLTRDTSHDHGARLAGRGMRIAHQSLLN